jgi:hypothetical protein
MLQGNRTNFIHMKITPAKFILSVLAYAIPTMILGMVWHFILFHELYDSLGIYNRKEPIIALGFTSMLVQGVIMAYLYPYYYGDKSTLSKGIVFSLTMGMFLFSVSTLANAAKIEVSSMQSWLLVQAAFHLIQFVIAGAALGYINRK